MIDALALAERNAFVVHSVDRAHQRRADTKWLVESRRDPATRFVVVWRDEILVSEAASAHLVRLSASDVEQLSTQCQNTPADVVLLGELAGTLYFAIGVDDACDGLPDAIRDVGEMIDLRRVALLMEPEEGALAAQAKAMVHWHRQHRYCGRCGSSTESEEGGYVRRCRNPECSQVHFPRVDPAIIVLVTSGAKCLLGRQPRWPEGRYSNIAGFVEPGESLETAVMRELYEETGVEVSAVRYHSSQPWPFPQSLMVGFVAEAASQTIRLHDGELEDARWFSREEIRDGLQQGSLGLPSDYSISFHLIEDWFDAGDCGRLRELVAAAGAAW